MSPVKKDKRNYRQKLCKWHSDCHTDPGIHFSETVYVCNSTFLIWLTNQPFKIVSSPELVTTQFARVRLQTQALGEYTISEGWLPSLDISLTIQTESVFLSFFTLKHHKWRQSRLILLNVFIISFYSYFRIFANTKLHIYILGKPNFALKYTLKHSLIKIISTTTCFGLCKSPDLYFKQPNFCTKIHFKTFTY